MLCGDFLERRSDASLRRLEAPTTTHLEMPIHDLAASEVAMEEVNY